MGLCCCCCCTICYYVAAPAIAIITFFTASSPFNNAQPLSLSPSSSPSPTAKLSTSWINDPQFTPNLTTYNWHLSSTDYSMAQPHNWSVASIAILKKLMLHASLVL
ncbi:hypothetical protein CsSME_00027584 [Camellia sinensis var. sinensis]